MRPITRVSDPSGKLDPVGFEVFVIDTVRELSVMPTGKLTLKKERVFPSNRWKVFVTNGLLRQDELNETVKVFSRENEVEEQRE